MFSKRLVELRKESKMTQKELADRFGLTPKAISFYELGQREPSNDLIIELSRFFGVSSDYLLGTTNIRNPKSGQDDLFEEFPEGVDVLRRSTKELSPEARKVMIRHMNNFINDLKEMEKED